MKPPSRTAPGKITAGSVAVDQHDRDDREPEAERGQNDAPVNAVRQTADRHLNARPPSTAISMNNPIVVVRCLGPHPHTGTSA
jgi:hypothetical protein